jgi:hypothetical protein
MPGTFEPPRNCLATKSEVGRAGINHPVHGTTNWERRFYPRDLPATGSKFRAGRARRVRTTDHPTVLAATNKCLAQSNKSRTESRATKKRRNLQAARQFRTS